MNEITTVCNTFIYKRYSLIEKYQKEMMAAEVLSQLVPENIPEILVKGNNLCVMEFVNGINGTEVADKELLTQNTALILADIYKKYVPLEIGASGSWMNTLSVLRKEFQALKDNLSSEVYNTLVQDLRIIEQRTCRYQKLTYVHRDLHLGNIVLGEKGWYLIDFEHAMEAPIELEFQNSILWNDEMSLNINTAKKVLQKYNVPYNEQLEKLMLSYYVADQLLIASKEMDTDKTPLLLELFERVS